MSNRFLLSLVALAFAPAAWSQQAPVERTIYMAAVEPKGGVTVDREAFPKNALPDGGGYILKRPDEKGRWEVSTYRWDPGTVVVNQGELVTLEIVGINGSHHSIAIPGYDVKGMVQRGEVARITFRADKPGMFKIVCASHMPSMQSELVVLPAR